MSSFIIPGRKPVTATATVTRTRSGFVIPKRTTQPAAGIIAPVAPTFRSQILTGPYISTQERAAAAKNILTSVTQQPAVGPLVWPKPVPIQKPVVSTVKPIQTVTQPTVYRGRPAVTPIEQQRMKAVAPLIVTKPTARFVIPPRAQPIGALTPTERANRSAVTSMWTGAINVPATVKPNLSGQHLTEYNPTLSRAPTWFENQIIKATPLGQASSALLNAAYTMRFAGDSAIRQVGELYTKVSGKENPDITRMVGLAVEDAKKQLKVIQQRGLVSPKQGSILWSALNAAPTIGTAILVSALGQPEVSATLLGAYVDALSYGTYREAGVGVGKAAVGAAAKGLFSAATMMIPTGQLTSVIGKMADTAAERAGVFALRVASQGILGGTRQLASNVIDASVLDRWSKDGLPANMKIVMSGVMSAAITCALLTVPIAAFQAYVDKYDMVNQVARNIKRDNPGLSDSLYLQGASEFIDFAKQIAELRTTATGAAQFAEAMGKLKDASPYANISEYDVMVELFKSMKFGNQPAATFTTGQAPGAVGTALAPTSVTVPQPTVMPNIGAVPMVPVVPSVQTIPQPLSAVSTVPSTQPIYNAVEHGAVMLPSAHEWSGIWHSKDTDYPVTVTEVTTDAKGNPMARIKESDAYIPLTQIEPTKQTVAPVPARFVIPARPIPAVVQVSQPAPAIPYAANVPTGYQGLVSYREPAPVTPQKVPSAAISTGQPSVSIPTPTTAPEIAAAAVTPLEQPTMVTTVQKLTDTVDRLAAKVDELTGRKPVPSPIVRYSYDMNTSTVNALDVNGNHIGNPVKVKNVQEAQDLTAKLNVDLQTKPPLMVTAPTETATHRQVIVQHLAERIARGESVSAAVRADYPELQAIAPPVTAPRVVAAKGPGVAQPSVKPAPWLARNQQPTARELLVDVAAHHQLTQDSKRLFDSRVLAHSPMLENIFATQGGISIDALASVLKSEEGILFPSPNVINADDWLMQRLEEGAGAAAGKATRTIAGEELFVKGQPIFTSAASKRAAEVGGPLTVANQRTAAALQGPANEGIFAGEVVGLPFNIAAEKGANVSGTNIGANVPAPTGYVAGVPIQAGTTARTIPAENVQKAALAVKDYVTTLANHPGMKESTYHAQLQDRMNQLGVPAGLFTPTQILAMYQASKGPSQLWNLTNRVLLRLNAYNTAQTLLADALNDIPSSVLTKEQKRTLQDATLDNADFMRSLDFIDRELTKAQVTADLRERFDTLLAAEKEKAAIRLARVSQRAADKLKTAEWDAAAKDKALKDKAARTKAISQIDRMLAAVAKNVQTGHTIKLDYVDTIRSIMNGLAKGNKLIADAAANMTTEQLQYLAGAIKTQIAVGRVAYMADRAAREEVIANTVARALPNLTPMAGYQTKLLDPATYTAIVSRYGRFRNAAAEAGMGITPAETIFKMLGLREMYMDNLGGLTDARQMTDAWRKERLERAQELGIATDLQQRRIGIWLINQTPGGRNHLLMGNKLTEQDIDSIVLTAQEMQYAEFMRAHFDKEFPVLRDYFRDFYNIEVNPVDAYTSLFNSSEFQTDYERAMKDLTFQGAVSGQRKTPKVSMAIKRTGGDNPVELNIFRIGDSYDDTLAYALHLGPRLLKWWGVTMNDEVASKLGDLGNLYVRKQLVNLTYRGGPGGRTAASGVDVSLDWLRRNLSRAQILFRPTSAAIHLIQIVNVAGVTGPNYAIKAAALLVSDPKYAEWVTKNFPLLRDSMKNYFEILGLPDDQLAKIGGAMFKWCHNAARVTGAIGNYMWLCEQNEVPLDWEQPNKELLTEAMVLVNKEFGAEDIVSAPAALETGFGIRDDKSLARMLVQFQQDVLAKFDLLRTQLGDGWKEGDPRKVARGLFWIFLVGTALIAGIRYGYRKLINAITGKKSAATDMYWKEFLKDIGENFPWGSSTQAVFQYGDIPVPVLSNLVDTAQQAANFLAYQSAYAKLRAAVRAGTGLGSIIGIPGIGTIGQIVSGFIPTGTTTPTGTVKPMKPSNPTFKKPTKP